MGKYSTKQAAGAQEIETLGGDYDLKWDDETQMSVNAHAALLSQFAKAGVFFDRLVETCPIQLTSNNAPAVRNLITTVMVSMINGATRFRHFDRLPNRGHGLPRPKDGSARSGKSAWTRGTSCLSTASEATARMSQMSRLRRSWVLKSVGSA